MTQIEEKSLLAQNKLMGDIISNHEHIHYCVNVMAEKLLDVLKSATEGKDLSYTLSKESHEKLIDGLVVLKDKSKWERLGNLAASAVPENKIKSEILRSLQ